MSMSGDAEFAAAVKTVQFSAVSVDIRPRFQDIRILAWAADLAAAVKPVESSAELAGDKVLGLGV